MLASRGGEVGLKDKILQVKNLKKYFPIEGGFLSSDKEFLRAVDGVSFEISRGETLSLVGESGCGKTTIGKVILRLIQPTSGEIWLNGINITGLGSRDMRQRRKEMQIIFQDPFSSLNPRMKVGDIIGEALSIHGLSGEKEQRNKMIVHLFEMVGLSTKQINRYPHEFSGGQRQRVGIARAIAVNPKLIVADEPISSLDVSIQAQILNLLEDLQKNLNLSYLFISHDLNVVAHISNYVAIMYLGKIVEIGPAQTLYQNPRHPYTRALLSSVPVPDPSLKRKEIILSGEVPSPINPPSGCHFHPRCFEATSECSKEEQELREVVPGSFVACRNMFTNDKKLLKIDQIKKDDKFPL